MAVWLSAVLTAFVWSKLDCRSCRLQKLSSSPKDAIVSSSSSHPNPNKSRVIGLLESTYFPKELTELSEQLSLPIISPNAGAIPPVEFTHLISLVPYSLDNVHDYALSIAALPANVGKTRKLKADMKPLAIDFLPPLTSRLGRRVKHGGTPDLLTKAVAPTKGFANGGAVVYDLTAGLGQDSLLMANAGARRVHMVERDPIVGALLYDALRRLDIVVEQTLDPITKAKAAALSECLTLEIGDACKTLENLQQRDGVAIECSRPDIIYLDPMYPIRKKSASVKKNMQILQGLLHSQDDSINDNLRLKEEESILNLALSCAKVRVVVKRPSVAPTLGKEQHTPSYQVSGSINRWDVYMMQE